MNIDTINAALKDQKRLLAVAEGNLQSSTKVRDDAAAEIARLTDLKRKASAPTEPLPTPTNQAPVVRFRRVGEYNDKVYTFAAIRGGSGDRPWAVTQTNSGPHLPGMSWDELLEFIGYDRWHTIEGLATIPSAGITHNVNVSDVDAALDASCRAGRMSAMQYVGRQ